MATPLGGERKDITSVDWQGREITLKDVPVAINKGTGTVGVDIDELLKAEQKYLAEEEGIDALDVHPLLLLYAPAKFDKGRGSITQKFRFNKMLFHLWKTLEKMNYGDSFIYDKFGSARAGPVPVHLKDRLKELERKGIIEVEWHSRPGESIKCELTEKGSMIASGLWENTPDDIKEAVLKTKEELLFVDATQLKEKFHRLYPKYKKDYTELDTE